MRHQGTMKDLKDFKQTIKTMFPHIGVQIKSIQFFGESKRCLEITCDRTREELNLLNKLGREAGLLPDGDLRNYDF